jgi:hypothetical protein
MSSAASGPGKMLEPAPQVPKKLAEIPYFFAHLTIWMNPSMKLWSWLYPTAQRSAQVEHNFLRSLRRVCYWS